MEFVELQERFRSLENFIENLIFLFINFRLCMLLETAFLREQLDVESTRLLTEEYFVEMRNKIVFGYLLKHFVILSWSVKNELEGDYFLPEPFILLIKVLRFLHERITHCLL